MNNTNQPAGHLAQLQFTETPFLIAVQEPDSFSACAKKLSEQHLFIKLGMIGLLCLLSGSFFYRHNIRSFVPKILPVNCAKSRWLISPA